jgi:CDP-glucose 4,6-dehydratase
VASLVNQEFWKNKRVFLTGHTGFIGGWLTLSLHRLGAEVYGYSLAPNSNPSLFQTADIGKLCHHHVGDIRNFADVQKQMQIAKPDIVLHLAAQALVRPAQHLD